MRAMNEAEISGNIIEHFGSLRDPRLERTRLHKLSDILVIAICAIICHADSWEDVEAYGHAKESWLKTFLELENGIPSHDTFNRVFARLDAKQFEICFVNWVSAVAKITAGQVVALDGKLPRGSRDGAIGKGAIDIVSAWATENQIALGQVKVNDKSNEITAIPELLSMLELSGCIITIDAMGCQTEIVKQIVKEKEADYAIALKENQGRLYEDVVLLFKDLEKSNYTAYLFDYAETFNLGHGRSEKRQCWTISDPEVLKYLRGFEKWEKLRTVSCIRSYRNENGHESIDERYHIASITGAKHLLTVIRSHWGIENRLHWTLDIAFDEDQCRVRKDNGPENFAILRHIALNLLKQEKTSKHSIKAKRLQAGWDDTYLLKVLGGFPELVYT
jgi:predicted transposase YbfD/YdcC